MFDTDQKIYLGFGLVTFFRDFTFILEITGDHLHVYRDHLSVQGLEA
jgi:hypothetical protein